MARGSDRIRECLRVRAKQIGKLERPTAALGFGDGVFNKTKRLLRLAFLVQSLRQRAGNRREKNIVALSSQYRACAAQMPNAGGRFTTRDQEFAQSYETARVIRNQRVLFGDSYQL